MYCASRCVKEKRKKKEKEKSSFAETSKGFYRPIPLVAQLISTGLR